MATDTPDWTGSQHVSQPEPASSNLIVQGGDTGATLTLTPPADATGFQLLCTPNIAVSPTFTVTGMSTGAQYLEVTFPIGGGGGLGEPISGNREDVSFVVIGWDNGGPSPETAAYISWVFGAMVVAPTADALQPLPVTLQGAAGLETAPARAGGFPQLVVVQMPPMYAWAGYVTSDAASFITGVAGKSIRLRKATLQFTASGSFAVSLQSSATNIGVYETFPQSTITNEAFATIDWEGLPLPAGEGLSLEGTTGVRMSGVITYDLY